MVSGERRTRSAKEKSHRGRSCTRTAKQTAISQQVHAAIIVIGLLGNLRNTPGAFIQARRGTSDLHAPDWNLLKLDWMRLGMLLLPCPAQVPGRSRMNTSAETENKIV